MHAHLATEWNNTNNRAEYLFLGDAHFVIYMREYSWLEEITGVVGGYTPCDQLRSLLLAERDIVKGALTLPSRDKGSNFGPLVKRLTYLQSGRSLDEPFNKLFVDRPLKAL